MDDSSVPFNSGFISLGSLDDTCLESHSINLFRADVPDPLYDLPPPWDQLDVTLAQIDHCIVCLRFSKNISEVTVIRDYLNMINAELNTKAKTIKALYESLRSESGICMSSFCSFSRHGSEMWFQVHTLCSAEFCSNYGSCNNNLESLAVLNQGYLNVMDTPELGDENKGLFAGGFRIGDFICTYGGEVRLEDCSGGSANKYLMQLAMKYLIDGSKSLSYGRFINHGCHGRANARTQFMLSITEIFLGIVALKKIDPHEQILLDFSGVIPHDRNSHLSVLKVCKCINCCYQGKSPSVRTRQSHQKLSIKDSLEEWTEDN